MRGKPDCDLFFSPTLRTLTFANPADVMQACTTSCKQPCPAVLWSKCPNQAGWFRETLTQEKRPGSHTSSSTTTVVRDKALCTPRCLLSILMTFSSSRSELQQCTSTLRRLFFSRISFDNVAVRVVIFGSKAVPFREKA